MKDSFIWDVCGSLVNIYDTSLKLSLGANDIKLCMVVIYESDKKARVFVPSNPLWPFLFFFGKGQEPTPEGSHITKH
jgi:hypothetical protein